ncbi:MAG TPA: AMP-binding protein [Tepidisphaeraceae bacterium]|jgi:long-chain acyl-CoA synthetase
MLFEHLFRNADARPNDIAIIDDTGQYTYQQLATSAAGLGLYLSMQTNQPRVGLLLPASAGFVASFYGTLLAGKAVVPINFLLGDREVAHVIADSGIDTIVTIPQLAGRLKESNLKVVDLMALPRPPAGAIAPHFPTVGADDLAVLMYTSGTSGLPKGVMLTYGNLQSDVDASIEHAALQHKHKFLGVIPLFHAFGMTAMMLAPIQLGSTVIYIARFSPVAAVKAMREHQVSLMFGVPSMFAAMAHLKNASADDFKSIYALISGGEPLPGALRENFQQRFGVTLYEGYGLTETSPVVALNVPGWVKVGSVGRTLPGVQVRITDDEGKPLPPGQSGEVWLKGPMIMKGYFNLPDETTKALTADGYFKTGDMGMVDTEGYLHITGRKKELIIVAGEKASPREIEDVLLRHPSVREAAVVGKKDPSRGEVVVAFVVPKEGATLAADEVREFARSQGLVNWKVPREVSVVQDLPRSPTGKVLKRVLTEQANAQP